MDDTIILSDLPGVLREMTGERFTYQRLYRLFTNRDLKQGKRTNAGRWFVLQQDLPSIVEDLRKMAKVEEPVE